MLFFGAYYVAYFCNFAFSLSFYIKLDEAYVDLVYISDGALEANYFSFLIDSLSTRGSY